MSNRLGADIMIVPEGYDPHIDAVLLAGTPSTFYLPEYAIEELNNIKEDVGIASMSAQTFLATLRASCCSYPVQLVGIDYETDFIVKPWLKNTIYRDLRDGEIIIGYRVSGLPGETIKIFGKDLTIAGRLEQTGMGFDAMIFMTRSTIAMLSKEAEKIIERPLTNDGSLTSVVMIKLKPEYDSRASSIEINRLLNKKGMYALFSKRFVNNIGHGLKIVSWIIRIAFIFFWILAVLIVALIFSMTLSERKKEFGVFRALGASRKKLVLLCLAEIFMISIYGAFLGTILGCIAVIIGSPIVIGTLNLPFLLPSLSNFIILFAASLIVSVLTGIFAAYRSAVKASRIDIQAIMRGV